MVLRRGWEIFGNDQVGPEFTKQLGTRRRRAQKTPLVPPVQAGFYFEDGRRCLGWRCLVQRNAGIARLSALWRVQARATSRRISRTRELGVDSAHCKDAPPGGGRGPLAS